MVLQQRQEQERSGDQSSTGCTVGEVMPPSSVVQPTAAAPADSGLQGAGVASQPVPGTAGSETLLTRPLIPFGQGWLSGTCEH